MNYESTKRVDSQVMPGVSYSLIKPTAYTRGLLFIRTEQAREKARLFLAEAAVIQAMPPAERDLEKLVRISETLRAVVNAGIESEYIRFFLGAVFNLTIDGVVVTDSELLLKSGPDNLLAEIGATIRELYRSTLPTDDDPAVASTMPVPLTVN